MTTAAVGKGIEDVTYEDLYARWERGNWSASEIDFSVDREHWRERLTEDQRKAAMFNWTLFLHGEDAVADGLGPYIDAVPREEQKYFLATQQVDEARHAVFFKRFFDEVVREADGTVAEALAATSEHLTPGWHRMYGRLERMADDLRRKPSMPLLAQGIALYHLMIEATLGQPAQHAFEGFLEESGLLPGFYEGMRNVALDEQRHIAFGVKLLSELVQDPECRDAVEAMMTELTPIGLTVALPPNMDKAVYFESLGFTMEELYTYAQASVFQKLKMIGMPFQTLHAAFPFPPDITPEECAEWSLRLVDRNLIGHRRGPVPRDPETVELLFETLRWAVDPRHAPSERTIIEWNLTDLEPWHMVLDNGSTTVARGHRPDADLQLTCRYEDWVDVFAKREDPRKLMLTRRVRPKGSFRTLMRMQKLFG